MGLARAVAITFLVGVAAVLLLELVLALVISITEDGRTSWPEYFYVAQYLIFAIAAGCAGWIGESYSRSNWLATSALALIFWVIILYVFFGLDISTARGSTQLAALATPLLTTGWVARALRLRH